MRYRITANVEGDAVAANGFVTSHGMYSIGVSVDENNRVQQFYIETTLKDNEKLPSIKQGEGPVKLNIAYHKPSCRDDMIEKMIYLESLGSFWWRIKSFNLHESREEWIPDNENDKKKIALIGFSSKQQYNTTPQPLHDHQIIDLLNMEDDEKEMVIPMAFYREASVNFENHKYIIAFQNYFLMIEGLYGKGLSGLKNLVKALKSSPDLVNATNKMLEKIATDPSNSHFKTIDKELKDLKKNMDVEGLMFWLVHTRGQLNHFSVKSSRKQGSPLAQRDYRTHAYIAGGISVFLYTIFHNRVLRNKGYGK